MSKIIESRFRVLQFDEEDALLVDVEDMNLPVYVNKRREEYSETLQNKIDDLNPGNIIEAEIQSESITRQDDIWKFIDISITDETRFYFIEDADSYSSHVSELASKIESTRENTVRTSISSDGELIGFITVGLDQGDGFWRGLQTGTNTHENDIENLESIDDPPYEVIYTRNSDESLLVFYHFAKKGTDPAQTILSANR